MRIQTNSLTKKTDLRLRIVDHEKYFQDASKKGYNSLSAYIRAVLEGKELLITPEVIERILMNFGHLRKY
jgi:hypothetical protein